MSEQPGLLAILELGGYPNFTGLYQRLGFNATLVSSQRQALAYLKSRIPALVVAEYNFQSDFRDRTSNLETLMARLQRHPQVKVIAIYPPEQAERLNKLRGRFVIHAALPLPVTADAMERTLTQAMLVPGAV